MKLHNPPTLFLYPLFQSLSLFCFLSESEEPYTSIKGDLQVTLWKDLERTKAELLELFPEDETLRRAVPFFVPVSQ